MVMVTPPLPLNRLERYPVHRPVYIEPKLSDSTHFSENEGRTDASSDGRGFRVSSEGWRVAIFPREREQRP